MAHHPLSLVETLSQDTDLVLCLTHFTDEGRVDGLTAALRSNRNLRKVRILVVEDGFLPALCDYVCCTGHLPSLVGILEALEGCNSLEDLIFNQVDLAPPEHAAAVRRLLRSMPGLKKLEFYCCHLSLSGAQVIIEGLHECQSLLESLSVIRSLCPGIRIAQPADNTLRVWLDSNDWVSEADYGGRVNRSEIAIALVEGTSQSDRNSLRVLNLEGNNVTDKAMERIIHHLTQRQAPLERVLLRENFVGSSTSRAIVGLLINSTMLAMEVDIRDRVLQPFAERIIVGEGLRYNFCLEEFIIHYPYVEREVQHYLQRNRTGREAIQNENRELWLELLIQNQDNLVALHYYLQQCPAWI